MTETARSRRVVVTGIGLISALGNDLGTFWDGLRSNRNTIAPFDDLPSDQFPVGAGARPQAFSGKIDEFGPLPKDKKKSIRKGLKVMCREIQMGVAAAQLALSDAGWGEGGYDPDRSGMVFGSDYILTTPDEFESAVRACLNDDRHFTYDRWGEYAIPKVAPLWLLKYLPNMPASHIAIYNDMRGPSNSLTVREASSQLALHEAMATIVRGHADLMLAGATGTRIHSLRTIHITMQEDVARGRTADEICSRPFDTRRSGMVLGEGAAVLVLEEAASAEARGATILAEVVGAGSSTVYQTNGQPDRQASMAQAMRAALQSAGMTSEQIGHYQAQGLSTKAGDAAEAQAVAQVLGADRVPVTSVSGGLGNPGAAIGFLQVVAGIAALRSGQLFALPNFEEADRECPVRPASADDAPGDCFLCAAASPQAQAAAAILRRWEA